MNRGLLATLGAVAKQLREEHGISPEDMATELQKTGRGSASKVSRFENGKQYEEVDRTIDVYAKRMGLSLLDLLDDAGHHLEAAGVKRNRRPVKASAPAADAEPGPPARESVGRAQDRRRAKRQGRASSG